MKPFVIAFDLDDTLYKERDFVSSAFRAVSRLITSDLRSQKEYYEIMYQAWLHGENAFDTLQKVHPYTDIKPLLDAYRYHIPVIKLSQEVIDILQWLHSLETCEIALITDGRSRTQRNKINILGLTQWIADDNLFISEEQHHDKHDSDNFEALMALHPDCNFYYVGDNIEKDFYHPNRLGWTTVQLNDIDHVNIFPQDLDFGEDHQAKIKIDHISELRQLISCRQN